jgi:hypothetical protein
VSSGRGEWSTLPFCVLRSTGFAAELLEPLAFRRTTAALDVLGKVEEALGTLQADVVGALRERAAAETLGTRRRYWRRVVRGLTARRAGDVTPHPLPAAVEALVSAWDAAVAERDLREDEARAVFESEMPERRRALRDLAADDRFREAVWLSAPQMEEVGIRRYLVAWSPERRPSEVRSVERQIAGYAQRLTVKNETTSFFGPVNYALLEDAGGVTSSAGAGKTRRRRALVAHWAVDALAAALGEDDRVSPWLRPRLTAAAAVEESGVLVVGGRRVRVTPVVAEALRAADGRRTLAEFARGAGALVVEEALRRLERGGAVVLRPEIPITAEHPLGALLSWVDRLPDECEGKLAWRIFLEDVAAIEGEFADAPLQRKRSLLARLEEMIGARTGAPARRKGGQIYADRLALYEEGVGALTPFALGRSFADELVRQLTPILDLCAAHGSWLQRATEEAVVGSVPELLQGVPWLAVVDRLADAQDVSTRSPVEEGLLRLVEQRAKDREVVVSPEEARELAGEVVTTSAPLIASPDVMLAARDAGSLRRGEFALVLGECHDTLMLWGSALALHPAREDAVRAVGELLEAARNGVEVASVLPAWRTKIAPLEYPGPTIEVKARSSKGERERIRILDVTARADERGLYLSAPGWPRLKLYNGESTTLSHRAFALPRVIPPSVSTGVHTPRLRVGNAVFQRERWEVRCGDLLPGRYRGTSFELMRDYSRSSRRLGLPRRVFARLPREVKPVLVDRMNYFLLELLVHLAQPDETLVLTEMLPGPDELWLRDGGESFTSELRLAFAHDGGADASG